MYVLLVLKTNSLCGPVIPFFTFLAVILN